MASPTTAIHPPAHLDYSLVGEESTRAIERGLAEADWYQCPVPRATLRRLLERKDGPAIRDTLILFSLLAITGGATAAWWGSWWALPTYFVYATLYGTSSDSRWHECGHGTAFKTDWMNRALYEIASFMVMRESVVWRWSHTRHHSDTIIVGRDPEIQVPRPPDLLTHALSLMAVGGYRTFFPKILRHAAGGISAEERTFIPETEFPKIRWRARIYLTIYLLVIAAALISHSWLPVFLFVVPQVFGTWLMIIHNTPQHAGLAENVLDHRLNCRTIYMNPVSRFLYWNMNYHLEHHMFPLVPYHALPKLHALIRDDCPPPYPSILSAWREIIPTLLRQTRDPGFHVKRQLPPPTKAARMVHRHADAQPDADGWLEVCAATDLQREGVIRFDHGRKTYALIRDARDALHATDGICTHGNNHLADGLVVNGTIECPKHNGRFRLLDGAPARPPVCRGLAVYPLEKRGDRLWLNIVRPTGCGARQPEPLRLRVVATRNISTFIRELVLEPANGTRLTGFEPGDYLQFHIPAFDRIAFRDFDIPEPYATVWRNQHVFDLVASNTNTPKYNNYSIAGNRNDTYPLVFNIRIATPPPGQDCPPGAGSSYMFALKPGDEITALGPSGDFHIRPTRREMAYIGGGAGMAPLRAHLSHLFESEATARRVNFWYGARSRQELFYQDYFTGLAEKHNNFRFHPTLSSPVPDDGWTGPAGFIHEVARDSYLATHPNPSAIEYYLCGPPAMIRACRQMLDDLGVPEQNISHDEF